MFLIQYMGPTPRYEKHPHTIISKPKSFIGFVVYWGLYFITKQCAPFIRSVRRVVSTPSRWLIFGKSCINCHKIDKPSRFGYSKRINRSEIKRCYLLENMSVCNCFLHFGRKYMSKLSFLSVVQKRLWCYYFGRHCTYIGR